MFMEEICFIESSFADKLENLCQRVENEQTVLCDEIKLIPQGKIESLNLCVTDAISLFIFSTLHAWKLLLKIGPSKCPTFSSPLFQNLARPFFSRAKSKNTPGFHPL